jgi:hypothetical protein
MKLTASGKRFSRSRECWPDNPVQLRRHRDLGVAADHRQRVLGEPLEDEAVRALRLERRQAGDHLVQHQGEGVEIAAPVEHLAARRACLLGRAVLELAHEHPDLGDLEAAAAGGVLGGEVLRQAEVDDLQPGLIAVVLHDHQVVRRDVAMDDAGGVDRPQPPQRLDAQPDGGGDRERPALAQPIPDVLALDVLPDHVEAAVGQAGEVVEDGDVGVLDLGRQPGLADEALLRYGIGGQVLAQDLDHPQLLQVDVAHEVDLAHAAAGEALDHLVFAVEDGPRLARAQGRPPGPVEATSIESKLV